MSDIFYHIAFALAHAFVGASGDRRVETFDWQDGIPLPRGKLVRVTVEYVDEGASVVWAVGEKAEVIAE